MTLTQLLATFDRCDRDRQTVTPAMWDALLSLAKKAERDRDAAAATERAAIVADLILDAEAREDEHDPNEGPCYVAIALRQAARRYESNAHHEATK